MDDLISRQAAIDAVIALKTEHRVSWKDAVIDTLDELPSAQPIIRCKDCKKAPKCYGDVVMKSKGGGYIYCQLTFCSEAERRTDAD